MFTLINISQHSSITQDGEAAGGTVSQSSSASITNHGGGDSQAVVSVANDEGEETVTGEGDNVSVDMADGEPPVVVIDDEELVLLTGDGGEEGDGVGESEGEGEADRDCGDGGEAPGQEEADLPVVDFSEFDHGNFGDSQATQSVSITSIFDLFTL